jgi:hypothetical protein
MEDVIDEIGSRWTEFNDIEQSAITTALAGELVALIYRNINCNIGVKIWDSETRIRAEVCA